MSTLSHTLPPAWPYPFLCSAKAKKHRQIPNRRAECDQQQALQPRSLGLQRSQVGATRMRFHPRRCSRIPIAYMFGTYGVDSLGAPRILCKRGGIAKHRYINNGGRTRVLPGRKLLATSNATRVPRPCPIPQDDP